MVQGEILSEAKDKNIVSRSAITTKLFEIINLICGPLAHLVEHRPFKAVVLGSRPRRLTNHSPSANDKS